MEIILSHVHLDYDGFSSMILAKKLYPNAKIVLSGDVSLHLKDVYNFYIDKFEIFKASEIDINLIKRIILVDTNNFKRLGKFSVLSDKKDLDLIVYDHHLSYDYGSNTSLLLNKIFNKNLTISNIESTIALMGIYEDTGNFTFKNTKAIDLLYASKLIGLGANFNFAIKSVNKSLDKIHSNLLMEFLDKGETKTINNLKYFIVSYATDTFINNIDIIINKVLEFIECDACFIITGNFKKSIIIGRSTNKNIEINKILKVFNGGGHSFAGSGTIKNIDLFDISSKLIYEINKLKIDFKNAKSIMKSPIKTIHSDLKIKDTLKIMAEFGYSGLPIVDGENLTGITSRKDVEKAVRLGYGNAPVKAYMTKKVITVDALDSIDIVKNLMVQYEISRIPVVENNKIIGIITRSDLLEALYDEKNIEKIYFNKNIKKIINDLKVKLPEQITSIFTAIRKISKTQNTKIYMVGGIVRDLILNIKNDDIDLVVEGNAIEFVKILIDEIPFKKVTFHEKFKTAIIYFDDNLKIDFASTRIEYYEFPSSLPNIEIGNIKDDLYRRDFSINALAIDLSDENYNIIDYYDGYKDILDKKIKILHNLSFIEDPTRIIRAIRFATRYDFHFDDTTLDLMYQAISNGILKNLSWERFRAELILIFKEKNFIKSIYFLNDLDIFKLIHKKIIINTEKIEEFDKISNSDLLKLENFDSWKLYFLKLLEELNKEELSFVLERFGFNKKFIEEYSFENSKIEEITVKLKKAFKNSQIYDILSIIPNEIGAYIYFKNIDLHQKIYIYYSELKNIKPLIKGKDLISLGYIQNKNFSKILKELFYIQLDNPKSVKDEIFSIWKAVGRENGNGI